MSDQINNLLRRAVDDPTALPTLARELVRAGYIGCTELERAWEFAAEFKGIERGAWVVVEAGSEAHEQLKKPQHVLRIFMVRHGALLGVQLGDYALMILREKPDRYGNFMFTASLFKHLGRHDQQRYHSMCQQTDPELCLDLLESHIRMKHPQYQDIGASEILDFARYNKKYEGASIEYPTTATAA